MDYQPYVLWSIDEKDGKYVVSRGEESYSFDTYRSAFFAQNLFNDQASWRFNKDCMSSDSCLMIDNCGIIGPSYEFMRQKDPNVRIFFGAENTNTYFQFYNKNPPNRIQRWILYKLTGINIKLI